MNINNFSCNLQLCCFIYPLRKGLLVWGILNLMRYCVLDGISSALTGYRILFHYSRQDDDRYRDLLSITIMFVATLTLAIANLVFNIVFIVGLHKRDERMLRHHYYYWTVTLVMYIVFFITANLLSLFFVHVYNWMFYHVDPVTFHLTFMRRILGILDIVVQIYFLLLVRNQIRILNKGDEMTFLDALDLETEGRDRRPQSMADTVRHAIETQPGLSTHRF